MSEIKSTSKQTTWFKPPGNAEVLDTEMFLRAAEPVEVSLKKLRNSNIVVYSAGQSSPLMFFFIFIWWDINEVFFFSFPFYGLF